MDPELERTLPSSRHLVELRKRMEAEPVDVYDLTAHLETEGVNDTVALSRYRVDTTFELAHRAFTPAKPAPATISTIAPVELRRAFARALALLLGSGLIGLLALVTGLDGPSVVLATSLAWVSSQGGSAVAWIRVWGTERSSALAAGARWSVWASGLGASLGIAVLWWVGVPDLAASVLFLLGVLAYSMAVSLLMVAGRSGAVAGIVTATGAVVALVQATGFAATMVTVWACAVALAALLALVCWAILTAGGDARLGRMDLVNACPPTLQAALLAGGTVVLVTRPVAVLPFVAGVLTAVAACDPMSVLLRARLRSLAQRSGQLGRVTVRAQAAVTASAVFPAVVYCLVAWFAMVLTAAPAQMLAGTLIAGALYVMVVGYSTVLRAFGCGWLAVLVVIPALVAPMLWLIHPAAGLAVAGAGIVVAGICLVRIIADPRRYL